MKTADPTLLNDADFAVQVTPEKVKKPASRWRNKWRALEYVECDCGCPGYAGEEYFEGDCCEPQSYPSKDVAETSAADEQAFDVIEFGRTVDEYLGAFEIDGDA